MTKMALLMSVFLVACDEASEPLATPDGATARCDQDGSLDITVSGEVLEQHEGATVWVSAVEPLTDPRDAPVRVFLSDTVQNGTFYTHCGQSLDENYVYPSLAVIVDVDGDGVCSDADVAVIHQRYGWDRDVEIFVEGDDTLRPVTELRTWDERSLCDYYVR